MRGNEQLQSVGGLPSPPELRGSVLGYRGFRIALDHPRVRLELPSGSVSLLLLLDGRLRLRPVHSTGFRRLDGPFLSGLHSTATLAWHSGRLHGIDVTLTPPGAYRIIGRPMERFTDGFTELDHVFGPDATGLVERLRALPDWPERFAALDGWLLARLTAGPRPTERVDWAYRRLTLEQGPRTLAEVAEAVGWTERHLRARFRTEIGLTPKAVARVSRLQHALRLHEQQGMPWSIVAAHCGFHDQAHLSKEVRAMTGLTPTELARLRLTPGGTAVNPSALGPSALGTSALDDAALDRLPAQVTSLLLPPE